MAIRILKGDSRDRLKELPDESIHCVITSPPYWGQRNYGGEDAMIGLEPTFDLHLENLSVVFKEVYRVLRNDGTLWLNYGDGYWKKSKNDDFKPKDLMLMPSRVAMTLQADGWYLRSKVIWKKPNPLPESIKDRPTTSYEEILLMSKEQRYFYDAEAVKTKSERPRAYKDHEDLRCRPHAWANSPDYHGDMPGVEKSVKDEKNKPAENTANLRNVWEISKHPFPGAHFATFPPLLVETCLKAGTSEHGACSGCGAQWIRRIENPRIPDEIRNRSADTKMSYHTRSLGGGQKLQNWRDANPPRTVGWESSCSCDPVPRVIPATVLDPFGGAGTVGMVANELGRDALLVEINDEYVEMAKNRISEKFQLFSSVEVS